MNGFLDEVASDLYSRYGDSLSQSVILFPSLRTRRFFVDSLSRIVSRPLWQPRWTTIDALMSQITGLHSGDRIRLITELYQIYSEYHEETFDKFYFWGEMLLNDFDTIDKYLIDASMLFSNIRDLKEIEADLSYLTPEQLEILSSFWKSFGEEKNFSEEQRKFMKIWCTLSDIYTRFKARLCELGIAYTGMIHRAAVEKIERGEASLDDAPTHFVVAGFNALSACEKRLFRFLKENYQTDFYWDYDDYYVENMDHEAGMFIRQNLNLFPASSPLKHDHMATGKNLFSVATVSNVVQCKYASQVLQELSLNAPLDKQTAIVLTDENLLMPLLYALPKDAGKINVTMGYPLKSTAVYTFLERLIELQSHTRQKGEETFFYHIDVQGLLAHPFVTHSDKQNCQSLSQKLIKERRISVSQHLLGDTPLFRTLFRSTKSWGELSVYFEEVLEKIMMAISNAPDQKQNQEFLLTCLEEIVKLRHCLEQCQMKQELTMSIYISLLRRHLQTVRIPFDGEPLEGLQVMGILETRNLDFKNVLILSMNDDNFPGNRMGDSSFVPQNLRAAYDLPTPEHHEGVYAYYFYRLIQRAENVYMLYCSHADDKSTGEPSRYIRQLDYESGIQVQKFNVGVDVNLDETRSFEIAKDEKVMASLLRFVHPESSSTLSPTAFFRYVACPMQFYFHSIAHLQPSDDELGEEVDAPMFGSILHKAAQYLYQTILYQPHPKQLLEALCSGTQVEEAVQRAINEEYLNDNAAKKQDYTGDLMLVADIVKRYLKGGVIPYDAEHDDFQVLGVEMPVAYNFPFQTEDNKTLTLKFAGIADRVDELTNGCLRVVDYKTGSRQLDFAGVEALFHGEGRERLPNVLQTLLYAMMLSRSKSKDAIPSLYYVRFIRQEDYSPLLNDGQRGKSGVSYYEYASEFEQLLSDTLREMYNPNIPFRQCEDEKMCEYCDFKALCGRFN